AGALSAAADGAPRATHRRSGRAGRIRRGRRLCPERTFGWRLRQHRPLKAPASASRRSRRENPKARRSSMLPKTTLAMIDGVRVVVPDSLDLITPYVLREQQDWFEDEIKFLRQL